MDRNMAVSMLTEVRVLDPHIPTSKLRMIYREARTR